MKKEKMAQKPPSNEWSYAKCVAVGLAMKHREERLQESKTIYEKQLEIAQKTSKSIENTINNIQNFIKDIKNTTLQNAAQIVNNIIIQPVLTLILQIPKIFASIAEFQHKTGEMVKQAGEKLTSILGEVKNFVERKISQGLKKIAKKIFLLFYSNIQDENFEDDENLEVYKSRETRNFLVKFLGDILKGNVSGNIKNTERQSSDK